MFDDVDDFHRKFGLPTEVTYPKPQLMNDRDFRYRTAFLSEEYRELIEAHARGDLPGVADALADIVWVALGTACYCGIPFNDVWSEVKRANMEKRPWQEGDAVKPRNMSNEIVKPDGWTPPDIRAALGL